MSDSARVRASSLWGAFLLVVVCATVAFPQAPAEEELPVRTIALVRDGASWYFDAGIDAFLLELNELATGRYRVELRNEFDAEYDTAAIDRLLRRAYADPDVDLVYAAGIVATEQAARLPASVRTKPTMAGALQFTDTRGQPISPEGTSSVENFTFITEPSRVTIDLELLRNLSQATRLYALIDDRLPAVFPHLQDSRTRLIGELGVELEIILTGDDVESTLAQIPDEARAVYVALLPQMPEADRVKLYAALADRGVVTVAMFGSRAVELGATAGLAPDNAKTVARRTALNLHQLLLGVRTSNLPVYLPVQDSLVINAMSAARAGWSPDYDTSLAATFVNEESVRFGGSSLTLEEAMRRAAKQSATVLVAREEARIQRHGIRLAQSFLRPSLDLAATHSRVGFTDRIDRLTPNYSQSGRYGVQLRQSIFSDALWTDVRVQRFDAGAARHDLRASELDAIEAAAIAYLNHLAARALYRIEKANLQLTQNNLQLAKLRVEIGAAEASEIFRWERDYAQARADLFQREADRGTALVELNRIMGVPRETRWEVEDIELASNEFYFMDASLGPRIRNQAEYNVFRRFLQWFAVETAPELAAIGRSLDGQNARLRQRTRSFFLPTLDANAGYDRAVEGVAGTTADFENRFTVGVSLGFPIFDGGLRQSQRRQQRAIVRQIEAQQEAIVQQVEQRALNSSYLIAATHPNIRLSREALEASRRNYEAVREKYSQGAASILELLDAQQARLAQEQRAALAVYDYLIEVHRLQRAISWFEFEQSAEEAEAWIARFEEFVRTDAARRGAREGR